MRKTNHHFLCLRSKPGRNLLPKLLRFYFRKSNMVKCNKTTDFLFWFPHCCLYEKRAFHSLSHSSSLENPSVLTGYVGVISASAQPNITSFIAFLLATCAKSSMHKIIMIFNKCFFFQILKSFHIDYSIIHFSSQTYYFSKTLFTIKQCYAIIITWIKHCFIT